MKNECVLANVTTSTIITAVSATAAATAM